MRRTPPLRVDHAGSSDQPLRLYGGYPDLRNDLGREQVIADLVGWLDVRVTRVAGVIAAGRAARRGTFATRRCRATAAA